VVTIMSSAHEGQRWGLRSVGRRPCRPCSRGHPRRANGLGYGSGWSEERARIQSHPRSQSRHGGAGRWGTPAENGGALGSGAAAVVGQGSGWVALAGVRGGADRANGT
jgi:hypothetical protein